MTILIAFLAIYFLGCITPKLVDLALDGIERIQRRRRARLPTPTTINGIGRTLDVHKRRGRMGVVM